MKSIFLALCLLLVVPGALARTVLIDVRTPAEFSEGHLSGAINIDHELIAQRISSAGVRKDDRVLLYCKSGRRAGIAQEALRHLGYQDVENLGGLEAARSRLEQK